MAPSCVVTTERRRVGRDPAQAAGQHAVAVACGDREGAQHDRARPRGRDQPTPGAVLGGDRLLADPAVRARPRSGGRSSSRWRATAPSRTGWCARCRATTGLSTRRVEVGQHVLARRLVAAPPGRHRRQRQRLVEQHLGTAAAGTGTAPGSRARPLPSPLTIDTVPSRAASTSPGTPSWESGRSSSGSQKAASTRRRMTSTGSSRPIERCQTRPSRTTQVGALDQREARAARTGRPGRTRSRCPRPGVSSTMRGTSARLGASACSATRIAWKNGAEPVDPACRGTARAAPGRRPAGSPSRSRRRTAPACGRPSTVHCAVGVRGPGRPRPGTAGGRRAAGSGRPARRKPAWPKTTSGGSSRSAEQPARSVEVGQDQVEQLGRWVERRLRARPTRSRRAASAPGRAPRAAPAATPYGR